MEVKEIKEKETWEIFFCIIFKNYVLGADPEAVTCNLLSYASRIIFVLHADHAIRLTRGGAGEWATWLRPVLICKWSENILKTVKTLS